MSAGSPPPRVLNARADARDVAPSRDELCSGGAAWGGVSRTVVAGSLAVRLTGLDARLASLVERAYEGFVATEPPAGARETFVHVVRSERSAYLHLSRGEGFVEDARVAARWEGDALDLWSYRFAARFDREAREARLLLCDGTDDELAQAVENCLRFVVAAAALAAGGFLLHAAGVALGGRAWLFFGPSGAGKSTTASHAPPDAELLGDDLILVQPDGESAWRACGVPFRGSFSRGRNAATSGRLVLACRLYQASANRLEEVPRILRVSELLAQVPFLMDDPPLRLRAAEIIESFVRDVPVKRLHLVRDGSYWELIAG